MPVQFLSPERIYLVQSYTKYPATTKRSVAESGSWEWRAGLLHQGLTASRVLKTRGITKKKDVPSLMEYVSASERLIISFNRVQVNNEEPDGLVPSECRGDGRGLFTTVPQHV